MVVSLREEIEAPATNTAQIIGDFINRYMQNILVVDDAIDQRSSMEFIPRMEPKGELVIRFEPDTKLMFITAKKFKEYCVIYQINYKETLKKLKEEGVFLKSDTKRMTKGMKITTTGVQALIFDTSIGGFLDIGNLLPKVAEVEDASAGG
jgi:hypoxanthine phosphoribosyltransferase